MFEGIELWIKGCVARRSENFFYPKLFILAAVLIQIFSCLSCAPLRPIAPPPKYKSPAPQASQTGTGGYAGKTESITGLAQWDLVLSPWLGTPYKSGGNTKSGTDCSGFVSSVFMEKEGMFIPRTASDEFKIGKSVDRGNLIIGDLVFFGKRGSIDHVGIFVGNGSFIHASSSRGVMVSPLEDAYWKPLYMGARRYL